MKNVQGSLGKLMLAAAFGLSAGAALAAESERPLLLADTHGEESVMGEARDAMEEAGEETSDAWITTKVKSALLANDATPGMEIEVDTKNGVVMLTGTVATEAQREAAIAEAQSIEGVKEVMADNLKAVD